jgi:hypothetical protein
LRMTLGNQPCVTPHLMHSVCREVGARRKTCRLIEDPPAVSVLSSGTSLPSSCNTLLHVSLLEQLRDDPQDRVEKARRANQLSFHQQVWTILPAGISPLDRAETFRSIWIRMHCKITR